jgi:transposase, IS30 family
MKLFTTMILHKVTQIKENASLIIFSQSNPQLVCDVIKKDKTMTIASAKAFKRIPKLMRKTLTVDNGKEFSLFKELEDKNGLCIYFVDSYSAWQRASNENTNGLIRQYVLKGTNFRDITNKNLAFAVKRLNQRPRKCLNYQRPHQVI